MGLLRLIFGTVATGGPRRAGVFAHIILTHQLVGPQALLRVFASFFIMDGQNERRIKPSGNTGTSMSCYARSTRMLVP